MGMEGSYPYCKAWCLATGDYDLEMHDRAERDLPNHEACYFDEAAGRWIGFYEIPAGELRVRILNELESEPRNPTKMSRKIRRAWRERQRAVSPQKE